MQSDSPYRHWQLEDIPWHAFDASKVRPELISLAKAACMVEHNGNDYARYLCDVFADDPEFQETAKIWAREEVQHGQVLRRWAELADPNFDFDASFARFTAGYRLPQVNASVRGSRSGELVARCVVEVGTSAYYTAMREYTDEPVLKEICTRIAADELRHYKLFYDYLKIYQKKEKIGRVHKCFIALGRIGESEDDELAYAFYAAHPDRPYDRRVFIKRYLACAYPIYRRRHVERMTSMVLKAAGLSPQGRLQPLFSHIAWHLMQWRTRALSA